jgi:predicted amidohydrolase YtcJ
MANEFRHFKPESAFVPEFRESRELAEKKELEFVIDTSSGKIAKIGDPRDVKEWLEAQKKERPDLTIAPETGGVALPGLTDAHAHLLYATLDVIQPGYLFGIESKSALAAGVSEQLRKDEPKDIPQMFLGHNTTAVSDFWKDDLDEITNKPIGIWDLSLHGARLNSAMLNLLMAEARQEEKAGRKVSGEIHKNGQVTEGYSILAIQIAEAHCGVEKISESMDKKLESWISQGITDIHDMDVLSWNDFAAVLLSRKKWEEKQGTEFPVRQIFLNRVIAEELLKRQKELEKAGLFNYDRDWQLIGLKLLADGSFGAHTAMLGEPYSDIGGKGIEFDSLAELNKTIEFAREKGIDKIAMHAIGDAGIARAVETAKKWVRVAEKAKIDPTRFRIEHFELPLGVLEETKSLGIWVNSEPNFLTDFIYRDRLSGRVMQICPHAEIISQGIPMHFGSDGMPSSALFGLWAATHHPVPKQRIPFERALAAYSLMAADYEHHSGRGRLQVGAPADIIILNRETLNKLLPGEATEEEFVKLGKESGYQADKVNELEAGIAKIYRQGRLIKNKTERQ